MRMVVVFLGLVAGISVVRGQALGASHPFLTALPRPFVIAHRGGGGSTEPEGTLPAFQRLGRDFRDAVVEIDVRATRDGRLVVFHDERLDRTTNGRGPVDRLTLQQLQSLDAGYCFRPDAATSKQGCQHVAGTYPKRGAGYRIPTLDEVLAVVPADAHLSVELKARGIEDLVAEKLRHRRQDRLIVGAIDGKASARIRALLPQAAHYASAAMVACFEAEAWNPFDRVDNCTGAHLVALPDSRLITSLRLLGYLHGRGIAAAAFTVDDEASMERLIRRGVDGIVTNFPERAIGTIARLMPRAAATDPAEMQTPEPPAAPAANASLRIDVHSHVFNGEDIPPFMFMEKVFIKEQGLSAAAPLAALLATAVRLAADGYRRERKAIDRRLQSLERPSPPPLPRRSPKDAPTEPLPPPGDPRVEEVTTALAEDPGQRGDLLQVMRDAGELGLASEIQRLPAKDQAPKLARFLFDFVKRFTLPRSRNVVDMMNTFPSIDLFVTAMVDFDLWLGEKSGASIPEQIETLSKLSIIYDGRILPFVAYDPFRDEVTDGEALAWVKTAVEQYGFGGVKLYPPMGFRPSGNAERPVRDFKPWRSQIKEHLPPQALQDFGTRLDRRLGQLFEYCSQNGVPVMAHTNRSNYSHRNASAAANPLYWEPVLTNPATRSLRVSFGHFGGMGDLQGATWPHSIVGMMSKYDNVFADLSNYNLKRAADYFGALGLALASSRGLHTQLMYGSDWFMPTTLRSGSTYYTEFTRLMASSCQSSAEDFFGHNAIRYLGLGSADPSGSRLRKFYATHKVAARWPGKVDALLRATPTAWDGCQRKP